MKTVDRTEKEVRTTPDKTDILGDDSFWDIDSLMPKTKRKQTGRADPAPGARPADRQANRPASGRDGLRGEERPASRTESALRTSSRADERSASSPTAASPRAGAAVPAFSEAPEKSYSYPGMPIYRVDIFPWPNSYTFFGNFCKYALSSRKMTAKEADPAPFFSFMPQYHQMTAPVLKYYLWWRDRFENGSALKADFSYLLLYIYEIINLPDVIAPEIGADRLARLWIEYRSAYPKIEKYLSEWLADYCLIHNVRPQEELMRRISEHGRQSSTLSSFYLTSEQIRQPDLLLSTYSYKDSKYRTESSKDLFDTHIPAALDVFFASFERSDEQKPTFRPPQKITRTSYDGAVCAFREKKRIDVCIQPTYPANAGFSLYVTDAVKYAENCVRSHLGIRARLSCPSLTEPMRRTIEGYFREHLPSPLAAKSAPAEDFGGKYEPTSRGFSDEEARAIEQDSLIVAERLGGVFENDPAAVFFPTGKQTRPSPDETPEGGLRSAQAGRAQTPDAALCTPERGETPEQRNAAKSGELLNVNALKALLYGGAAAFKKAAADAHLLPAALMERINEEAIERYGDAAIEEIDGNFVPIEDYRDEIGNWIGEYR